MRNRTSLGCAPQEEDSWVRGRKGGRETVFAGSEIVREEGIYLGAHHGFELYADVTDSHRCPSIILPVRVFFSPAFFST